MSLDGVALRALDERIRLLEVREKPVVALLPGGGPLGSRGAAESRRAQLQIAVRVEVHEAVPAQRRGILAQLMRWAQGRLLRVSDRPGRVLPVRLSSLPAMDMMDWRQPLEFGFVSARMPWWVGESGVQSAGVSAPWMNVQSGGVTRTIHRCEDLAVTPGEAGTHVTARLTNTGAGSLTMATLAAGARALRFTGLSVAPGQTLEIGRDSAGRLTARVGGISVLEMRSADSDDELWVRGGEEVAWYATADQPFTAALSWWGWYL